VSVSRGGQLEAGGSSREKLKLVRQSGCCFEEAAEGRRAKRGTKPWAKLSFDGIHLSWGSR